MEIVIGIIIGLAIGFFVGKLMEAKSAGEEKTQLVAKAQVLAANIEQIKLHHASEVQSMKSQMENERLYAAKLRAESDQQWAQKLESLKQEMQRMTIEQQKVAAEQLAAKQSALQETNRLQMDELLKPIKEQFADFKKSVEESKTQNEVNKKELQRMTIEQQKVAAEQLAAKQSALQETNRLQMDELLKPIKEQFADFKKSVEESKTQNEVNKKELQNTFEATMKLFQQEQQQAVLNLKEQTEKIGSDAANLTKALKGDSKMQGDWGEMVLETILENSGLRKDEEFFIQENTKDEEGKNYRPDVIVRFPEGRSVVIDSKVSLTAYSDALAAEDEAEQERLMKAHALSVRKHIDELAAKDYSKLVDDAIGFVLMFIPNETSYIAAMKQQPDLSRYAYQKKIIIISPSNLLMALQLAYNLWQYDRQNKNVEKIVKTAADLYDKVVGFEDTFMSVGDLITRLSGTFDKAKKQLYDGTGNVMRRVESLKGLGVTPKKQIKELDNL